MNLTKLQPNIRHLTEIKELLFDQNWAKNTPDLELYYMYRDLAENDQGLRYDITVMPFIMLGQEYNKTAGHDHPLVPDTEMTYPEIYQVLEGQAIFLLQDSENDQIKDVYAIKAQENDQIIIPPNYEHLIINASGQELKTANWICAHFGSNIYKPFRSKHGFSYYGLKDNSGGVKWVKNENYSSIPSLRFLQANLWLDKFGLTKGQEMYSLVKDLSKLDFLKNPQKYNWS